MHGTLQIPEGMMRTGGNDIVIARGEKAENADTPRLYSSNGILSNVEKADTGFVYDIYFPTTGEMVFEDL